MSHVIVDVLRHHLADAPASEQGWMAAIRDPVVGPAMAEMHNAPDVAWTVGELAARAAVSRSLLNRRFREVLGRSPIRYLAAWRMHLATNHLATSELSVVEIASRVGYDSEEAFSRAFKRSTGLPPSRWRAQHRTAVVNDAPSD